MILLTISNVFAFSDSAQVINFILNALAAQFHVLHCNALVLNWFVTCQLTYYLSWLAGVAYLVAFPEFSVRFLHFPFLIITTSYKYYFPFLMIIFELIGGCGVLGSIPRIPAPPFFTFPFLPSSSQATWKTGQFTLLSWDSITYLCFWVVYIVLQLIQRKLFT